MHPGYIGERGIFAEYNHIRKTPLAILQVERYDLRESQEIYEEITRLKSSRRLEDYFPYVNLVGLEPIDVETLYGVLLHSFAYTCQEWEPYNCHNCANAIFTVFQKRWMENLPQDYDLVNFCTKKHSWIELIPVKEMSQLSALTEINERVSKRIVIDPTGMYLSKQQKELQNYQPFFGAINNAPLEHYDSYLESQKQISIKSTRRPELNWEIIDA